MTPEQLDLAVWPLFAAMTERGIAVDAGKLEDLRDDVADELSAQEAALSVYAGVELDPHSPAAVAEWLESEGLLTGRRTRKGQVATDERALSQLAHLHPVPGCVLECRGLRKLLGTFIEPTLVRAQETGAVHPRWRLTTVKSGRPSMEDPNLLAFPTRDAWGKRVRECFVARPGHRLVSVDFEQVEPRVAAALSRDEALIEVFATGRDLYADMARRLFRLTEPDAVFKTEPFKTRYRQPAKIILLGCVLYGMQAELLYEELIRWGCGTSAAPFYDLAACEDFVRRRHEPYPRLAEMADRVCARGRRDDGWVFTAGGRGRSLPALLCDGHGWAARKLRAEAERQAFNHVIQGTAQEITKRAMRRVEDLKLPGVYPLLQIYDEMVYEVRVRGVRSADRADGAAVRLAATMADTLPCGDDLDRTVAIRTSFSVSDSWGGLK